MSAGVNEGYQTLFPFRACAGSNPRLTTFSRDRMVKVWHQLEREGEKHRWLFYDGGVRDALDYVEFMSDPTVYAYLVCDHDWETPLATFFVNNFIGHAALMHFVFLDAGQSRKREIGIDVCNFLLRNGEVSALIGITPKPFRHAWKYALSVGFVQKAVLPEACFLAYAEVPRLVDAVVTLCTRETLLPTHTGEYASGRRKEENTQS